ncbi:unnamed protein product [Linum tenue]|uniref:RRM domain-containing protein n=1 Tax=Linum tenue TaxID=586396 RepID=A0AAV0LB53_9ROSI|nr:unnamed protein product [Linum tenue]
MEGEIKLPRPKLFVGGVKRNTTGQELKEYFQQYGQVKDAFIVYCKQTSRSRGFGFVEFEDPSAAALALDEKQVDVEVAESKKTDNNETVDGSEGESHRRSKRVFVGGLPSTITPEEFQSFSESFGAVSNANLVHDKHSGKPRGFGFITFVSEDSADTALQNRFHELKGSQVEVKRANHKNNYAYDNFARRYHEYAALAAMNHSSYVNGYYYNYWYNHLNYQQASGLPYYWAPTPGNYCHYYQSCYPMAAANYASLSGDWSYDPANSLLCGYGDNDVVGHDQEDADIKITDKNGEGHEDHVWDVLRNLDEVNDHSDDQQGPDGEIRINGSAVHHNEETGSEHHDDKQVWRNLDGMNRELMEIKAGGGEHGELAVDRMLDESESGIGNVDEVDGGNAEVVSEMVTYSLENGKVDGWSMERKPLLMESLVAATCIHT